MSASIVIEKSAALAAQCPPPPPTPDNAASLPIHIERVGTEGPSVLIIHGGVQTGAGGGPLSFAKQRALSDRGWQLAFVDRPGFGKSPTRGVDDMVMDAVWIADLFGDGVHLIGHSWGGAEAFLAAARRPEAVRSLILVEPALQVLALTDPATDPETRAAVTEIVKPLLMAQTPADYGRNFVRTAGVAGSATFNAGEVEDATALRFGCALLQARMAPPPALHEAAETIRAAKIPVLAISGGWNPAFDAICRVVARLTEGRVATIQSPTHFPQLENPAEFNQAIEAFMQEAESR